MTGEQIKNILLQNGIKIAELHRLLDTSPQNMNRALNVADVKSGFIEKLCDTLNIDMTVFYGGTKYLPAVDVVNDRQVVPKYLYDELRKELYDNHDQIRDLQKKIEFLEGNKKPTGTDPQKNAV